MTGPAASATPQREGATLLPDGRQLAWSEWGLATDPVILLLPGSPGSSHFCPDVAATRRAGVRLVAVDRPGYGRSDPRPGRTVLDSAGDVVALLDHLGVPRAPVVGWSGGTTFALALAARAPERVSALALVAGAMPGDELPGGVDSLPAALRAAVLRTRQDPAGERLALLERARPLAEEPETIVPPAAADTDGERLSPGSDPDRSTRLLPGVGDALRAMFGHAFRQGADGWVDDVIAFRLPWGFSLRDIRPPTTVWYGAGDLLAERRDAQLLAAGIGGARLVIVPGAGHLLPVLAWAEILADLRASGGPG